MALWHSMVQKHPPAVAQQPQSTGNPGKPGNQCGIKRIGQDDRQIEGMLLQLCRQPEPAAQSTVTPVPVVDQHFINPGMGSEKLGNQWCCQQGDPCCREILTYRPDGRGGHNRIAQPVHGPDQDLPDLCRIDCRCCCCQLVRLYEP